MIDKLIIIIPTHNRQHYMRRVVKYYSQFPCMVYICDSSKEKGNIEFHDNIIYRWNPHSNFYGKIFDVLNETSAEFYALSPDDDFLKQETLMECYEIMKENAGYSFSIGKQVFFDIPFNGQFYSTPGANKLTGFRRIEGEMNDQYLRRFWTNYQNILWSLYNRETILTAFNTLIKCNFNNGNFVEMILGIEGLRKGDVYVSSEGLNYREVSMSDHWGSITPSINKNNISTIPSLYEDYNIFIDFYNEDGGHAKRCMDFYLNVKKIESENLYASFKKLLPKPIKNIISSMLPYSVRRRFEIIEDIKMSNLINASINNVC